VVGDRKTGRPVKFMGEARRAVRMAKNTWLLEKVKDVEKERFGGKKVWRCIMDMQCGRRQ